MITITEQSTQEAGRCQGCREKHKKVFVIQTQTYNTEHKSDLNFTLAYGVTIELRLCTQCLDQLRIRIADIIPF